jgi:uncharacterized membrane protein YczE
MMALVIGIALGGPIGWGTLLYAVIIGPIVQFFIHVLGGTADQATVSSDAG